jgi:hypothetical protein
VVWRRGEVGKRERGGVVSVSACTMCDGKCASAKGQRGDNRLLYLAD